MKDAKPTLTATIQGRERADRAHSLSGRLAWTIFQLVRASQRGCTPVTQPAPRWSDYVFQLRNLGFDIETISEKHSGEFAGTHGRYVLRDKVLIEGPAVKEWSGQGALEGGVPPVTTSKGVPA